MGGGGHHVGRGVTCRFDRTVNSFYKRCGKEGTRPGDPASSPDSGGEASR